LLLLGAANRETVLCLPFVFLVLNTGRIRPTKLLTHVLLQLLIVVCVRYCLIRLVVSTGSTGPLVREDHLQENLRFLTSLFSGNPRAWRMLMAFGGLWALVPLAWRSLPVVLKRTLLLVPLFVVAMIFVGNLDNEARIFNELVIVISIPVLVWLGRAAGQHEEVFHSEEDSA